ncbi:pyrin-like [Coregonus clupeaformis]|uniref:pyrin-like n=1 Tax=Coregonus clupeaformis TaxID=59861 RepID=UPI001E1C5C0C|nr:pyrin-like [Coregonus clupeaformis]
MLAVPSLLLTTLEEMNPHELKTFQWSLTSGLLPDCPPIPESQLENADRQVTVDHMVKTYGPERAVEITLRILRGMKRVDLAEKLETDHRGGTASTSHLPLFTPRPRSVLSPVGLPPISPLLSFGGSSMNSLLLTSAGISGQLRSQEEAASEMERKPAWEESGELPSTSSGMPRTIFSQCGYPPGPPPPSFLSHLGSFSGSSGQLRSQRMLAVPALLLTTLEEMNPHELKTFQSFLTSGLLPDCPPIPESQLENADRQVTVDQMVKTYGPERAVEITLRILRGMGVDPSEVRDRSQRR